MSALDRWSERKRRVREAEREAEASHAVAGDVAVDDGTPTGAARAVPDDDPDPQRAARLRADREAAEAVDLDALRPGSDLSPFFREGVPEALRRRALAALWRSDPVFANVDRLCDYDDDFRAASMVPGVIQSAWRAGRGYLFEEPGDRTEADEGTGNGTDGEADETTDESDRDPETLVAEARPHSPEPVPDGAAARSVAVPSGRDARDGEDRDGGERGATDARSPASSLAPSPASSLRARLGL